MAVKQKNNDEIIESALIGGVIGTALGALISGKGKDTLVAALIGAAIGASKQALAEAKENNLSVLIEEDGALYELRPDNSKRFIKKLKRTIPSIPPKFEIE
jgi:hypothetical protein